METHKISFLVLILLISFATVNAMVLAPALPVLALDFQLSSSVIQSVMTSFLLGFTFGQLIYGPLSARYGRKKTLYMGIGLQLLANGLCLVASFEKSLSVLIIARVLVALGAGVGLKMTFTLIHDCYHGVEASRKTSYLLSAFAIAPPIAVIIGGELSTYLNYQWCFIFCIFYGIFLLYLVSQLPETSPFKDENALKIKRIISDYLQAFKNRRLILGGVIMGFLTAINYIFAGIAPFVATHFFHLQTNKYGILNLFSSSGILWGSILSAYLAKSHSPYQVMWKGFLSLVLGMMIFGITNFYSDSVFFSLFFPMFFLQFGMPLIFSNASLLALQDTTNHAHASACISFLNLGIPTLASLLSQKLTIQRCTLPGYFLLIVSCVFTGLMVFTFISKASKKA